MLVTILVDVADATAIAGVATPGMRSSRSGSGVQRLADIQRALAAARVMTTGVRGRSRRSLFRIGGRSRAEWTTNVPSMRSMTSWSSPVASPAFSLRHEKQWGRSTMSAVTIATGSDMTSPLR
jgi:hypothetical protein